MNTLMEIAEAYSSKEGYEGFAEYCLLREKGLRKQALRTLADFIGRIRLLSPEGKRKIAAELSQLSFMEREFYQLPPHSILLPHPLKSCLVEVLQQWRADCPAAPEPCRWLGYLTEDASWYEAALQIDPDDQISLGCLAAACLNDIDFMTHHISESVFLGSERDAADALAKASDLISRLRPEVIKDELNKDLAYYRSLLQAWDDFKSDQAAADFVAWSKHKGLDFNFWTIVYYDEDGR